MVGDRPVPLIIIIIIILDDDNNKTIVVVVVGKGKKKEIKEKTVPKIKLKTDNYYIWLAKEKKIKRFE